MIPEFVYQLHRYDFRRNIYLEMGKKVEPVWKVSIVNNRKKNFPIKAAMSKRRDMADVNSKEVPDSFKVFRKPEKLSLKCDDFVLFEYIEKDPLMLGNPGMASRLSRYYYPDRVAQNVKKDLGQNSKKTEIVKKFKQLIEKETGTLGEEVPLEKGEKLPILGQLTNKAYSGLTILENVMYELPVFKQKTRKNDFVLVRVFEDGKYKYFLRRIRHVYTTGQIQPKLEVLCPYSRQFKSFVKRLLKFYIKRSFEKKNCIHLDEIKEILP